jgi:hypothetical protein
MIIAEGQPLPYKEQLPTTMTESGTVWNREKQHGEVGKSTA